MINNVKHPILLIALLAAIILSMGCGRKDSHSYIVADSLASGTTALSDIDQVSVACVSFEDPAGQEKCQAEKTAGTDWSSYDVGYITPGSKQLLIRVQSKQAFRGYLSIDNPCGHGRAITPIYIDAGEMQEAFFLALCNTPDNGQHDFTVAVFNQTGDRGKAAYVSYSY